MLLLQSLFTLGVEGKKELSERMTLDVHPAGNVQKEGKHHAPRKGAIHVNKCISAAKRSPKNVSPNSFFPSSSLPFIHFFT